jgi:hypothetical protein
MLGGDGKPELLGFASWMDRLSDRHREIIRCFGRW